MILAAHSVVRLFFSGSPIEHRKCKLAKLVRGPHPGIVFNEHYEGDGEIVFQHACKFGCEGIVIIAPAGSNTGLRSRTRQRLQ